MPKGHGEGSKQTQFRKLSKTLEARFHESYIPEPNSGCWIWLAGVDSKGYGRITAVTGKMVLAHRVAWALYHCKPQRFILHVCDNTYCVNPDHLYEGTQQQNVDDCIARGRRKYLRGITHPMAQLSVEQVLDIRNDPRSQKQIGQSYGLSQSAVSLIKTRKRWGCL